MGFRWKDMSEQEKENSFNAVMAERDKYLSQLQRIKKDCEIKLDQHQESKLGNAEIRMVLKHVWAMTLIEEEKS